MPAAPVLPHTLTALSRIPQSLGQGAPSPSSVPGLGWAQSTQERPGQGSLPALKPLQGGRSRRS